MFIMPCDKTMQQILNSKEEISSKCCQVLEVYKNPNSLSFKKEDNIILWLCDTLRESDQTLTEADVNDLWHVLKEILKDLASTAIDAELNFLQRKVVLTSAVPNVILTQLQAFAKGTSENIKITNSVLMSLTSICQSDSLFSVFKQQVSVFLKILGVLLELLLSNDSKVNLEVFKRLEDTLKLTISKSCLLTDAFAKSFMKDFFKYSFHPLAIVLSTPSLSNFSEDIQNLLNYIFCGRDVIKTFRLQSYRLSTCTKSLQYSSNSINELLLHINCHSSDGNALNMAKALSIILEGVFSRCVYDMRDIPFKLLAMILESMDIFTLLKDEAMDIDITKPKLKYSSKLALIYQLLCVCVKFRRGLLIEGNIDQLQFFQKLAEKLLTTNANNELQSEWIDCLRLLAQLSPEIIEPQIELVWKFCWLEYTPVDDSEATVGDFWSQVLNGYVSLRQVPKLFHKLSISARSSDGESNIRAIRSLPLSFASHLSSHIAKLPLKQVIDLWQILLDMASNPDAGNQGKATAIEITALLMLHLRLSDGGATIPISDKVIELMNATSNLADDLLKLYKDSEMQILLSLQLINAWCELRISLKLFRTDYQDATETYEVQENDDLLNLKIVFPNASSQLKKLLKKSITSEDKRLVIIVINLLVQKANLISISNQLFSKAGQKSFANIASFIFSDLDITIEIDNNLSIEEQNSKITPKNFPLTLYGLQMNLLPLFSSFLPPKKLVEIFSKALKYLKFEEQEVPPGEMSANSVTKQFLRSSLFTESKKLQTASVTAVLKFMAELIEGDKPNLKRKRGHDNLEEPNILTELCKNPKTWDLCCVPPKEEVLSNSNLMEHNPTWKQLKTASQNLSSFLERGVDLDWHSNEKEILNVLEMLEFLCTENSVLNNSLRCIIALLYLRSGLSSATSNSCLFLKIHRLLFKLLEKFDAIWISELTDRKQLLKELLRINKVATCEKELNFWIDKLTDRTVFLVLHDSSGLRSLEETLQNIEMVDNSFRDIHFLQIILKQLVHKINAVLNSRKPEYTESCQKLASQISTLLKEKLISVRKFKSLKENEKLYAYQVSLEGFGWMIEFYTNKLNSKDQIELTQSLKTLTMKLKRFLLLALEILECENDPHLVQAALHVVITIITHKERYEECLPEKFLLNCWKSLLVQVKNQILLQNSRPKTSQAQKSFESNEFLTSALDETIGKGLNRLLTKANVEELIQIFNNLTVESIACCSNFNQYDFCTVINVWNAIMRVELNREELASLKMCFQNFFQMLFLILHENQENLSLEVIIPSVEFLAMAVRKGCTHPNNAAECLQLCSFLSLKKPSTNNSVKMVTKLTLSLITMLDELVRKYSVQVTTSLASFLGVLEKIVTFLIELGEQEHFNSLEQSDQGAILSCLQKLDKLVCLMSNHEKQFSKGVAYVVAEYVLKIQQLTLHPSVKELFLPILNLFLKLSEENAVTILRLSLNEGGREILDILYKDYQKYYEYKGKI